MRESATKFSHKAEEQKVEQAEDDEEDGYSDEQDQFEGSFNQDAMKGKPLMLEEDEPAGSVSGSVKEAAKKSRGASETPWTFNEPAAIEQEEQQEDADLEDGAQQLHAFKKLHEKFEEQSKTVAFQKAKIAALQSELEEALKTISEKEAEVESAEKSSGN